MSLPRARRGAASGVRRGAAEGQLHGQPPAHASEGERTGDGPHVLSTKEAQDHTMSFTSIAPKRLALGFSVVAGLMLGANSALAAPAPDQVNVPALNSTLRQV